MAATLLRINKQHAAGCHCAAECSSSATEVSAIQTSLERSNIKKKLHILSTM